MENRLQEQERKQEYFCINRNKMKLLGSRLVWRETNTNWLINGECAFGVAWVPDGGEEKKRSFGGGLLQGKILKRSSLGCETWGIT